ncbi:MAG: hypothetical protein H7Y01_04980 [Ferruginibacter sp.]|nr:hypothetical protein [Chitinophagaceae bacterium]
MGNKKDKRKGGKHQVPQSAKTAAEPTKTPRVGDSVNFWQLRPVWSFSQLDFYAEVGGWIHLQPEDRDALLARFRDWEKMTWAEILSEGRKQNHSIFVSKCSDKAQERLEHLKLDDLEELMSLRVSSRARVIGIRVREVFRILWWDPEHAVCPSHLKGT